MKNNQKNSPNKRQGKDKSKRTQLETIFYFLQDHIATASMVTEATGIPQKNITRYKRDLEEKGLLAEVKKGYCKVTNHLAWYITTNANYFPESNQLNLFK